jgi:hypothetical protein
LVEALPASFADQVLEATFDSFGKGVVTAKDGARDLAAVSDGRWHGLCMATAECIRRNLVPPIKIAIILPWVFLVRRTPPAPFETTDVGTGHAL